MRNFFRFNRAPHERPEGVFSEEKIRIRTTRRRTVFFILVSVAFLGWSYVFFFSSIFRISDIQIEGRLVRDGGEVRKEAFNLLDKSGHWPFHERNIFLLQKDEFTRLLKEQLFADSVSVDKIYPNILRLNVEERQSSLVFISEERMYIIDREGVVVREITSKDEQGAILGAAQDSSSSENMPVLHTLHVEPDAVIVGNSFVTPFRMETWMDAFHDLDDLGFGYRKAVLDTPTSTKLVLRMFEPYEVYFSLIEPLGPQIESYYAFTKVKRDEKIQGYIDARIPGKIFYK